MGVMRFVCNIAIKWYRIKFRFPYNKCLIGGDETFVDE